MDLNEIAKTFNKRGFKAQVFENIGQVNDVLLKEIEAGQSIGIGGSMTVHESGISELLKKRGNKVYFHWEVPPEKRNEIRELAAHADVYLSSSNAVTKDGKLVNIDGTGNRVAAMFYGPDRVYIIFGRNKIVENEEEAVERIKTVACPKNAERLNRNTPCRKTGKCYDCLGEDRMCNVKVVIECPPPGKEINIMLVDQELGY